MDERVQVTQGVTLDERDTYIKTLEEEQIRAQAEKQMLIEEFRKEVKEEWTAEDVKRKIRDLMEVAYERMAFLMVNADSEAVQAALIRYVFNIGIGAIKVTSDNEADNELKTILESLNVENTNA